MMNTAAFLYGAGDVRIAEHRPDTPPNTSTDETVGIEIASVGICGSDLHYYKDGGIGSATISEPFIPGHEFSATLKADVESLGLQQGQLVAVDPASPCLSCEWCQKGYHNLCPSVRFIGGPPVQGALTQSMQVPVKNLVPLPNSITADQAAMLEPLGVCIHAIDLAAPRLLESVAVLGCGPIGLGIVQLLQLSGVGSIHTVDPQPHRSKLALQLGASSSGDTCQHILDATHGRGCDLVIEATNSPVGFADAVAAASIGGRLVLVGIPDGDKYSLSAAEPRRRGLTVKFSRRMGDVYPRAIDLVQQGKVDVDCLISHRFNLEDTATAFELQAQEEPGLIKSMVYPCGM